MYKLIIRPLLFLFDPEKVHHLTFKVIRVFRALGILGMMKKFYDVKHESLEREVFGLKFKNPVGLAAGFDKDAVLVNELAHFGFGFIEIGTLTPIPQDGNPKKRLFRLQGDSAIINRMGFNNGGVDAAFERLEKSFRVIKRKHNILLGGNIGKNKITANEDATEDYVYCFQTLFDVVDYFVVNVSSPNTPNLRALQEKEPLTRLLNTLQAINLLKDNPKPILLKIAPDLTDEQLMDIISIIAETQIAGVIATNTTISRDGLVSDNKMETGGLSGKPLTKRSTEVIRFLSQKSDNAFPIIGVGGIHTAEDALEKLDAGASLVQLYTGFIYEGPALIKEINEKLVRQIQQ